MKRLVVAFFLFIPLILWSQGLRAIGGGGLTHDVSGGGGTPSLRSSQCQGLGSSGGTSTPDFTVVSGDVLIGSVNWYTVSGRPTLVNNKSDTVTLLSDHSYVTNASTTMFYVQTPTAASDYHFTTAGGTSFNGYCVQVWSGLATSSVYDSSTDTGAVPNSSSCPITGATPSAGKRLWVSTVSIGTGSSQPTIDSSFTINASSGTGWYPFSTGMWFGGGIAYLYQASSSAVSPTWTTSGQSVCAQAAFVAL